MVRHLVTFIGLTTLIAGCALNPTPSLAEPSLADGGSASGCGGAELLGPDGERVDLTGTWEGVSSLWFVTQSGSCVTIEGLSRIADQRLGEDYRFVFTGELRPDFSIVGRRTWTWACSGPECPTRGGTRDVALRVGFADDGGAILEVPSAAVDYETDFTVTLERLGPDTDFPSPE
jgi:hypothetical protein